MRLSDLHPTDNFVLPAKTELQRIQRKRARPGGVAVGPLRLPPPVLALGRFDVSGIPVGYFADLAETAMYEALARREVDVLTRGVLQNRVLLTVLLRHDLHLLDLRDCAHDYPVLQSLRYTQTQELAADAYDQGYDGIVYHSAQQHAGVCYAVFDRALPTFRHISKIDLVHPATGAFHRALFNVLRGSRVTIA